MRAESPKSPTPLTLTWTLSAAIALSALALPIAQSVYPTGTTIYDPAKAWNGFTVLSPLAGQAVLVIDMNGAVVKRWEGFNNSAGGPARTAREVRDHVEESAGQPDHCVTFYGPG